MALQELERKLAESFDGLRQENKSLIDLLKHRQNILKTALPTETLRTEITDEREDYMNNVNPLLSHMAQKAKVNFNTTVNREYSDRHNTILEDSESPPLITEGQQQLAREKLTQYVSNSLTLHNLEGDQKRTVSQVIPEGKLSIEPLY